MEAFVGLLFLGLIVIGAVAMSASSAAARARAHAQRLEGTMHQLATSLRMTEWRLQWAEWRLSELHRGIHGSERSAELLGAVPATTHAATTHEATTHGTAAEEDAVHEAPEGPAVPVVVAAPRSFDWEGLIGVRLFAWLGGAALFLGLAFFLRYSIQENLIAPPLRVGLGLLVGAAALFGGDYLRTQADRAGQALSGAGVAILYAALYAARTLYELLPTGAAFAAMAAVTAVAGLMAVRKDALMLAVLGLLGGFMTPFLLSTGEDRPVALFIYVVLLDAGILVVAIRRHWPGLSLLGLGATTVIYGLWAHRFLDTEKAPYALLAAGILASLFSMPAWNANAESAPDPKGAARNLGHATAILASGAPFLLVLILTGMNTLEVSPWLLVGYLAMLEAGAWFTSRRTSFVPLLPAASALTSVTLAVHVGAHLASAQRPLVLLAFSVIPACKTVASLLRQKKPDGAALRNAAAISLAGALLVLGRLVVEARLTEYPVPMGEFALYAFAHVAGLALLAIVVASGAWLLGAQALSILATLLLFTLFTGSGDRAYSHWPILALATIAFWAIPYLLRRERRDRLAWLSRGTTLVLHFPLLYGVVQGHWDSLPRGAATLLCAGLASWSLRDAMRGIDATQDGRASVLAVLGGTAWFFVTITISIWLDNEWLTIAWALEASALAWLHAKTRHPGLLAASALLAAFTLVRLLANPLVWTYHAPSGIPIFNWELYTFGIPALALLVAPRWLAESELARALRLPAIFAAAGMVVLFVLLNVEIADFHSTGTSVTFHFSEGGFRQDMTYSLGWGVYALGLLGIGIVRDSRALRIGAIAVLGLTSAKVTLHDLWALGSLYRVASFVGLAIALLAVSFFTQRFVLRGTK